MNGNMPGKIEIFAPFAQAYELTTRILFQPFDLAKWLTIAFAAFLAGLADGTRATFQFRYNNSSGGDWKWSYKSFSNDMSAAWDHAVVWLVGGVIVFVVIFVVALIVVCFWAGSRGRFMFTDCIVRNRGAIAEPWNEFRREGNRLFVFQLVVSLALLLLLTLLAFPLLLPYLIHKDFGAFGIGQIVYLVAVFLVWIVIAICLGVMVWFMVPVMYRQRCTPVVALRQVLNLVAKYPGPILLYVLFCLVLMVGGTIVSCVATCVTCCIAMLPYIGTVLLLPLYTFYYAYTLCFLRQFGPEYDVWAVPPPLPTT